MVPSLYHTGVKLDVSVIKFDVSMLTENFIAWLKQEGLMQKNIEQLIGEYFYIHVIVYYSYAHSLKC